MGEEYEEMVSPGASLSAAERTATKSSAASAAVTSGLPERLRICAGMVKMCEPIEFGSDAILMDEAAKALVAFANERAVLLEALVGLNESILGKAESNASGNPEWEYVRDRVNAARAAIAKARAVRA